MDFLLISIFISFYLFFLVISSFVFVYLFGADSGVILLMLTDILSYCVLTHYWLRNLDQWCYSIY